MYCLCGLTLVFAVTTIVLRRKGRSFDGMIFKFLSSFGFMSVAFVGYCYNSDADPFYFCLVIFGLLFGLGGDVLLGIKEIAPKFRMKLIAMGTVSFLFCHVFFLVAFSRVLPFNWFPLIISVAIGIVVAILMVVLKFKINFKMGALLTIYYILLCYKALVCVFIYIETKDAAFLVAAIGCLFFVVSDSCLAFVYFTPTKSKNKLVTAELVTYYPAQLLLALSISLLN